MEVRSLFILLIYTIARNLHFFMVQLTLLFFEIVSIFFIIQLTLLFFEIVSIFFIIQLTLLYEKEAVFPLTS